MAKLPLDISRTRHISRCSLNGVLRDGDVKVVLGDSHGDPIHIRTRSDGLIILVREIE